MQNDDMSLVRLGDILTAIALLTRLPVKAEFTRSAASAWAYPVAGACIAAIAAAVAMLAIWLGMATPLVAGLWITVSIITTGAMHEDGLADCADGFWGGWTVDRRLEIMKDSQIGTYGVLALGLSITFRWVAAWLLLENGNGILALAAIEILSRAFMPAVMQSLPHARDTGLSHSQGRPSKQTALLAIGLAAITAFIIIGPTTLIITLIGAALCFSVIQIAKRKIGGQTGDVLGATQQITALGMLLCLA